MNKVKAILPIVLKILLGLVFIFSAVVKIIDMDKFELYIYSYHFFSLNFSFLVARVAIIVELVLGIGLVSNCFHKLIWWGSMAMLAVYTLFLTYALVLGRTDNCHCFGDIIEFNPWQSIVKNLVLMLLFLLVYRVKEFRFKGRWLALIGVTLAVSVAVFVVSPPDNFTPSYDPEHNLQEELFDGILSESPLDSLNLKQGKQVVCIFSTSCEFCRLSAQKLSLMQQLYGFPPENITYVFMGREEGIARFYEESGSAHYQDVLYEDAIRLLKVTNGYFPVIVFMEDGHVMHEYNLRNMKESEVKAFFQE